MNKLSVVLAVYNEENNLKDCLASVSDLASEIIIVDGGSTDQTVNIAKSFNARVIITDNPPIFHINKQKGLEAAKNEWVLQLDADERLTKDLKEEIKKVINMTDEEIEQYQLVLKKRELFLSHQKILDERDGKIGSESDNYAAFFIPRLNFFLGSYLRYGGVYPDGVIRLVKKGKAYFPCKSVHEQMVVDGRVGWLQYDLLHIDSPTFKRYLDRNFRYIKLMVLEMKKERIAKNLIQFLNYCVFKPTKWFFVTLIRHKGILDGFPGIIFSLFSALRFPRAYVRYLLNLN